MACETQLTTYQQKNQSLETAAQSLAQLIAVENAAVQALLNATPATYAQLLAALEAAQAEVAHAMIVAEQKMIEREQARLALEACLAQQNTNPPGP
jgi:hypothetical protein